MANFFTEAWREIAARPSGPMALRFYIQPLMSVLFAVRDGIHDARDGRPPYFWALFTDPTHRRELMRAGWHSVSKIAVIAFLLDTLYQLIVLKGLRPVQGLLVAMTLAVVPYTLLRGPAARVARAISRRRRSLRA
jgi:hypothetical protein